MERLALWVRIKPGEEEKVRYHLVHGFPARAFEHVGIREFNAFVGSGFLVMTYAYEGTFDDVFNRYDANEEIGRWLGRFSSLLEDVPAPIKGATCEQLLADDVVHWSTPTGGALAA